MGELKVFLKNDNSSCMLVDVSINFPLASIVICNFAVLVISLGDNDNEL